LVSTFASRSDFGEHLFANSLQLTSQKLGVPSAEIFFVHSLAAFVMIARVENGLGMEKS